MDPSKQKKSKEIKTENNNKSKIQNKKKEEPIKTTKITSNKDGPQSNNNDRLHTIENGHRKISTDYLGDKMKANGKGGSKKNNTPKKVQTIGKKKILDKKIDNDDEDNILARSMSFKISYKNAKQTFKKEDKPKEIKNYTKITKKPLNKKKDKPLNNKNQESEAIFSYNGIDITIQIHADDKMKDIIDKYIQKVGKKKDNLIFMYNGVQINENFSFTNQMNDDDNNRNKLNIVVSDIDTKEEPKQSEVISNYLICPECYENIVLKSKIIKLIINAKIIILKIK